MNPFWWLPGWPTAGGLAPPDPAGVPGVVYRLGDHGPEVAAAKHFLSRKFSSYADKLTATDEYDQPTADVVAEMQRRYQIPVSGVFDYGSQIRSGYVPKPVLFTVHGWMGVMDVMQPADCARALLDYFEWQPVGFNSGAFPLGIAAADGVRELKRLINDVYPHRKFAFAGISLGSIVISDVLDALRGGDMRHRLGDFLGGAAFANPRRQAGVFSGQPTDPGGEGIAGPYNLKDTPANWREYAHSGDIYSCKPLGEAGEPYHLVYTLILEKWNGTMLSILDEATDLLQRPIPEVITVVNAVIGAIGFYSGGQTPHIDFPIDPAVRFLRDELLFNPNQGGTVTPTPAPGTPQTPTKSVVALIGAVLTFAVPLILQVSTYLPTSWQAVIGGVIAILTGLGVYHTPNKAKT